MPDPQKIGNNNGNGGPGPGASPVGVVGIVLVTLYLALAIVLCLYMLVVLWPGAPALTQSQPPVARETPVAEASPTPTPATQSTRAVSPTSASVAASPSPAAESKPPQIEVFGFNFPIWDEVRLLLLVILGGALGSLVHASRSVYWQVGNRELRASWLGKYMLLPFGGSALALIFYVVIRGGFFSPQANVQQTSPFGFVALAALVGLFSEQAVLKLKEVAETILAKPGAGADDKPQDESGS